MSVLVEVDRRLAALEAAVAANRDALDEVRAIRRLLAAPENQWIGTVHAKRLLGVQSVNTVKAWARLGLLRSRQDPNGRLKVHLEDVLRERQMYEALSAMGSVDTPLTKEELEALQQPPAPEVRAIVDSILARVEERTPAHGRAGTR